MEKTEFLNIFPFSKLKFNFRLFYWQAGLNDKEFCKPNTFSLFS